MFLVVGGFFVIRYLMRESVRLMINHGGMKPYISTEEENLNQPIYLFLHGGSGRMSTT